MTSKRRENINLVSFICLSFLGPGRTMANLLKCPEFLRTCLTPKMSETSLRYRVFRSHTRRQVL